MRVVHLCRTFSKLSETFIYDYVTEQECQGVEASVLTHRRVNAEQRPFEKVTVVPWPSDWNPRRIGFRLQELLRLRVPYTSYWRILWPKIGMELDRITPDLIHAHFGRPGAMIAPLAEKRGIPLVVTFYGYDISELPQQKRWRDKYERIWQVADAIVVLSEEMKQRAVRWGAPPEHVHIVHLARDLDQFPYRPPEPPIREFVSVGRLTEKKGHLDAIRAIEGVAAEESDVHLRIVGDGPLREEIEQYIRSHELQNLVELMGARPNEEVAQILRSSDAFLLCSKTSSAGDREGTPTVLIEAQAVGLPCVSTRHAGIPEMIPPSNQYLLAEEGDVEGIAERIRRLRSCSEEEVKSFAEEGREIVEDSFSLSREVGTLCRLYRRVMRGSAGSER